MEVGLVIIADCSCNYNVFRCMESTDFYEILHPQGF